jgi:tetratricopeptide (TPR) repeat protein
VTSRELLQLAPEHSYPVPPLEPRDGIELFVARGRAVKPSLVADDAVAAICARLDHLPLALELAAARLRILSPDQLLQRLAQRLDLFKGGRDADPRQKTLRATIEWSYDLLSEDEQQLFARLSVFAGGCTLESAEAVCDADLDTLQSLVDKSLVRIDEDRFWMLETIREYARARLNGSREADDLRRRHAEHFLELAESAPGAAESQALSANVADTTEWRRRIEHDLDNVRAAFDWLRRTGDIGDALRIAFVVSWLYLWPRGGIGEAARWFDSILESRERLDAPKQVDALQSLAHFGMHLAWETRRELAEESLRLARDLGDKGREEWSLRRLGNVYLERDRRTGRRILLECEPLARELPEKGRLAWIQQNLGLMALYDGDLDEARRRLEESVELFEELGGEWQAVNALDGLAQVTLRLGDVDTARRVLRDCLPRAARVDALVTVCACLLSAAQVGLCDEDYDLAARLIAAAKAVREREGWEPDEFERDTFTSIERTTHDQLGGEFDRVWEEGQRLAVDDAVALALEAVAVAGAGDSRDPSPRAP